MKAKSKSMRGGPSSSNNNSSSHNSSSSSSGSSNSSSSSSSFCLRIGYRDLDGLTPSVDGVQVQYDPADVSFSLSGFEHWGRTRFGIPSSAKIRYCISSNNNSSNTSSNDNNNNNNNITNEVIPSISVFASLLEGQSVVIQSFNSCQHKKNRLVQVLQSYYPYIITILIAISLSSDLMTWLSRITPSVLKLEKILGFFNISDPNYIKYITGLFIDAFIGFISWSFCYLFIRRLWNPETMDDAIVKFAPDACFGGFASAAAAALKVIIKGKMSNN